MRRPGRIERATHATTASIQDVSVNHCGAYVLMAEQFLHGANVKNTLGREGGNSQKTIPRSHALTWAVTMRWMLLGVKQNEAPDPVHVTLISAYAVLLVAQHIAHLVQEPRLGGDMRRDRRIAGISTLRLCRRPNPGIGAPSRAESRIDSIQQFVTTYDRHRVKYVAPDCAGY
jgi:hypothetical protein